MSGPATRSPKRLLELLNDAAGGNVRLVDTKLLMQQPRYAALSYCWGNPKEHLQTKTVVGNVSAHYSCIRLSRLPRTIRDAVSCCRRLGIHFIWVDALCIVQDDNTDKMAEIEIMGHIYANAYLTIAASRAGGSDDGFLEPRRNPFFSAPVPCPGGGMVVAKWCYQGQGLLNSSRATFEKGRTKLLKDLEPLYSRGWTLQEAMLSRRTLFFSTFQPYFVCRTSCQSGGDPSPEEYFNAVDMWEMFPPVVERVSASRSLAQPIVELGYEWPCIAENFSSRVLSDLDDKALAIGAIKDQYVQRYGQYIAGLWFQYLAVDLLWSAVKRHARRDDELETFGPLYHRGFITNLPSWSWLSFDGSVRFEVVWHAFYSGKIRHIDDLSRRCRVTRVPPADNFGRITGEPLHLRGVLKRVLLMPSLGPGWENRRQSRSCYDIKIWDEIEETYAVETTRSAILEGRIGEAAMDDFVEISKKGVMPEAQRRVLFNHADDYGVPPRILECFLVATVGDRTGDRVLGTTPRGFSLIGQGHEIAYGLLVEDVPGTNGAKRRVGLFRSDEGKGFYFDDAVEGEFDMI